MAFSIIPGRMDGVAVAPEGLAPLPSRLTYVDQAEPGIRRIRKGKGFAYILPNGKLVRDKATLGRIRALAIPPAYTDVWICKDDCGHIQATGRDQRGRKQYRYHAGWNEARDANKFDKLIAFAEALPALRDRIMQDMTARGAGRSIVLAAVVSLLDKTLMRIGNVKYARSNDSFGVTTLQNRHVEVEGSKLRFSFRGKSGKTWSLSLSDRRIARIVKSVQDLPGQDLFQYLDDEGQVRDVDSTSVNAYIREIAGEAFSAKDFRTWAATVLAAEELLKLGPASTQKEAKTKVRQAIAEVSHRLGNTIAVCRKSYVHPGIIASYSEGRLCDCVGGQLDQGDDVKGLSRVEAAVLCFLKEIRTS